MLTKLIQTVGTKQNTKFKYGFELVVDKRPYLFYLNDQDEFANWSRLFGLIVEMNTRKIPVTLINPYDYENLKLGTKTVTKTNLPGQLKIGRNARLDAKLEPHKQSQSHNVSVDEVQLEKFEMRRTSVRDLTPSQTVDCRTVKDKDAQRLEFLEILKNVKQLAQKRKFETTIKPVPLSSSQ